MRGFLIPDGVRFNDLAEFFGKITEFYQMLLESLGLSAG